MAIAKGTLRIVDSGANRARDTHATRGLHVTLLDVGPHEALLRDERGPETALAGPVQVEHANKPEWGRGTIVREYDGKLDIEFANAGKKTLEAGAVFLRRVTE